VRKTRDQERKTVTNFGGVKSCRSVVGTGVNWRLMVAVVRMYA